ncbi:C-type lectin domain family 10 member A-like isoform X2 [Heterodontus francisci]|uniref:C-type lectin domain family 10 member A-like isoform X2 n=1 Tax=Heterodontus francisci TaxID=7792 RepID=UPI00355C046A
MSHEPTYSNFHILRGTADNDSTYNNFYSHRQRCNQEQVYEVKQGCGRKLSCGELPIVWGKACFLFLILGISFFMTFILLMIGLSGVIALRAEMKGELRQLKDKLNENQNTTSQITHQVGEKSNTNSTVYAVIALRAEMKGELRQLKDKLNEIQNTTSQITHQEGEETNTNSTVYAVSALRTEMKEGLHKLMTKLNETQTRTSDVKTNIPEPIMAPFGLKQSDSEICKEVKMILRMSITGVSAGKCPGKGQFFNGKCYDFSSNHLDWHRANESCQSMGYQLAEINNAMEQAFIEKNVNNTMHWIGELTNGTTKERLLAFHKPNNSEVSACGYRLENGTWFNMSCTEEHKWICQITLKEYLTSILENIKTHFC